MKRRLKRPISLAGVSTPPTPYDRRATDLLRNAQVAPVHVDDPLEQGAKLIVLRSLRDDPLAAMHNAKQLDDAQFAAGRHWQRIRHVTEIGGVKAIDPAKEAVDGGRGPEGISDEQIDAFKQMSAAIRALGLEGGALIQSFLDKGLTLHVIADEWGATTARDRDYVGRRVRECLDTLAVLFGYARNKDRRKGEEQEEIAL
jgi:hypothetical protein